MLLGVGVFDGVAVLVGVGVRVGVLVGVRVGVLVGCGVTVAQPSQTIVQFKVA